MPGAPPQAMRAGDWKVVRPKLDAPLELYDLKTDPGESRDLASSRKDVMAAMEKKLASARTPPRSQSQPPHRWFDKPWW
jgi:arylsulfatase A-like enzyme